MSLKMVVKLVQEYLRDLCGLLDFTIDRLSQNRIEGMSIVIFIDSAFRSIPISKIYTFYSVLSAVLLI